MKNKVKLEWFDPVSGARTPSEGEMILSGTVLTLGVSRDAKIDWLKQGYLVRYELNGKGIYVAPSEESVHGSLELQEDGTYVGDFFHHNHSSQLTVELIADE